MYIIIILFLVLLYISYKYKCYKNNCKINNSPKKWKMCDIYKKRPNHIFANLINKINYIETKDDDWDIYFPCGYNRNEIELLNFNNSLTIDFNNRMIFGINGCDRIVGKTKLWNHLVDKYGRELSKTIIPETYVLDSKKDREIFLKNYVIGDTYILKNKLQQQMGVKISNNYKELVNAHLNGNTLIQKFIKNQYLIKNHHFNMRIYVLIVCHKNKKDIYLYDEGNIRYAPEPFNLNNLNYKNMITKGVSSHKSIYHNKPITVFDFKQYLIKDNKNVNKIFNEMNKLIKLIFNGTKEHFCKLKNVGKAVTFQLFGGDVIFDDTLKPYILEFNKGPVLGCVKGIDIECEIKRKLQKDIFEIVKLIPKTANNGFTKLLEIN